MGSNKTWIPVDVKVHWFSFLGAKDLANCQRVCRSWVSLIEKTSTASLVKETGSQVAITLTPGGKLKLLHRVEYATNKENMGYLLSWAAGNRGKYIVIVFFLYSILYIHSSCTSFFLHKFFSVRGYFFFFRRYQRLRKNVPYFTLYSKE